MIEQSGHSIRVRFDTVDVFTERRFGGNPLAVFPDGSGLIDAEMQSLAAEMNLSETTFVLPPDDPVNTARVRIFNRTEEMAFAGHPCIGTAFVLARGSATSGNLLRLEVPAGVVPVELERRCGELVGGRLTAPSPLTLGAEYDPGAIAACVGLDQHDVDTDLHPPIVASMGNPYVIARVTPDALGCALPDVSSFREFRAANPELGHRFSLFLYTGDGSELRARMFAPLAGTFEDPATGSANAPLAGLLLSRSGADHAEFTVTQGVEMGRPSLLRLTATRSDGRITATVAGRCVPVLSGTAQVRDAEARQASGGQRASAGPGTDAGEEQSGFNGEA